MLNTLTEAELAIARSAEPGALVDLDEDDKVEVFETALPRVSTAVAKTARRAAVELRSERR